MKSRISIMAALAAMLLIAPATADAQGRGNGKKGNDGDRNRPELIRRGDLDRYDDRRESRGPKFCQNGEGHPVHGMQWCRDKGFGRSGGWDVLRRDDRRDDRRGDRRYDEYGRSGSYERAHQEFHLRHDRQCRIRAAERPLDIQWQIRVRSECKARHDEWHARAGVRHG